MESLLKGVLSGLGEQGIKKISQSVGVDPQIAEKVVKQTSSVLGAKMADNAKTKEGRDSLDKALREHNGSVFERLDDVVNPKVDTKGDKILKNVLGEKAEDFVVSVARDNGIDERLAQNLVGMITPLVLGKLGEEKKQSGLDADGVSELLHKEKENLLKGGGDSSLLSLASQFLDQDKDGSVVDDLLGMAQGFFKK